MKSRKSLLALAATSTLAGGLLLTSMASATQLIDTAAQQPSSKPITLAEGKCGEGKCGGDSDKEKEGKCGEGKCGGGQ